MLLGNCFTVYNVRCCDITGWVNRFANAGDAAMEVAETTATKVGLKFSFFDF